MQSAKLYEEFKNGKGLELLIMCLLLSNKGYAENPTDTDWVTAKEEIRSRTGMVIKKFDKSWKTLKEMGINPSRNEQNNRTFYRHLLCILHCHGRSTNVAPMRSWNRYRPW